MFILRPDVELLSERVAAGFVEVLSSTQSPADLYVSSAILDINTDF